MIIKKETLYIVLMVALFVIVGFSQSWNLSLSILNLCIISAIMAFGVNMQWGYAGLFNAGVVGFIAVGGLAAVLVSVPPVYETWQAGGINILLSALLLVVTTIMAILAYKKIHHPKMRAGVMAVIIIGGLLLMRPLFIEGRDAIESINSAQTGFLGGAGLPIILAWPVGALLAAGVAWIIGKIALNLRSDYLAIATLGIGEIMVAIAKNEDWLARGVKNVTGLNRPVPFEIDLQATLWFQELATMLGANIVTFSSIFVKICFALLFGAVLLLLYILFEMALHSPWGRMMRAIRDNEISASAMGKNVTKCHLQIFIIGSAIIGLAGAMLVTFDGQFTPASYQPLRYTFLIWVMVIIGGSGNNLGAILGGFLIWFYWIEVEPMGLWLIDTLTSFMDDTHPLRSHLLDSAAHMRLMTMGFILLLVMRFHPRGLLPEKTKAPQKVAQA